MNRKKIYLLLLAIFAMMQLNHAQVCNTAADGQQLAPVAETLPVLSDAANALQYQEYAAAESNALMQLLPACCTRCADLFTIKKALDSFQKKAYRNFKKPVDSSTDSVVRALLTRAAREQNFLEKMQLIEEARDKQYEIDEANKEQKNDLNKEIGNAIDDLKELQREYAPSSAEYRVIRKLLNDLMIALASEMIMDKEAALDSYDRFIRELNNATTTTTSTIRTTTRDASADFFQWFFNALTNKWEILENKFATSTQTSTIQTTTRAANNINSFIEWLINALANKLERF